MAATKRTISTVEADDGRPATQAPRLELAGAWLADAGFPVGAQV